jgi:hypothetical protein
MFSILNYSNAQNKSIEGFYMYLNQVLDDKEIESIELFETNYGCLGSKSYWDVTLFKKANKIEIKYYSYVAKDIQHLDVLVRRLDTVFSISKKSIIKKIKNEINKSDSRMVLTEGNFKFIVKTKEYENEFILKKVEGLSYLLRYNKTFEKYFSKRLVKKRIE